MNTNDNIVSATDVYAAMAAQNPDLQRQQQAAARQIQEEKSPQPTPVIPIKVPASGGNEAPSGNLTDRIKDLEKRLNVSGNSTAGPNRLGIDLFKDDYGQMTWYIKNESGMHISLGDSMGVVIKKGEVVDLLSRVTEEVILKSKDFLARLRNSSGGLRRLTQEEYFNELVVVEEQNRKIQALETSKYLNTKEGENKPQPVRPLIESQLNKLDLHYDTNPEINVKGLEPLHFIKWVMEEKLNIQEIDSMLGHPRVRSNTDITSTLIRKRHELV